MIHGLLAFSPPPEILEMEKPATEPKGGATVAPAKDFVASVPKPAPKTQWKRTVAMVLMTPLALLASAIKEVGDRGPQVGRGRPWRKPY